MSRKGRTRTGGSPAGVMIRESDLTLIRDDFLVTAAIPNRSVDLIVTSPPYNVSIEYGAVRDDISYGEYLEFTRRWLGRAWDLSRDDGRLCLNIPLDKNLGGQQPVYGDILGLAREAGWKYHSTIIWNEQNISRRTAWGSWRSARAPYVIAPVEVILVMFRERWRKTHPGVSDISRDEFIDWTNGVWTFGGEKKKKTRHPAPFPLELPRRCIRLFSFVGDTILDPFLGSGTTLLACAELGRKGIGVEIDPAYCAVAEERIREAIGGRAEVPEPSARKKS
jgi:site-specific DNA-methyltransferase (adenine-specific)